MLPGAGNHVKRLKNSATSVTMSDMQPQQQPPQFFPPYQPAPGDPQQPAPLQPQNASLPTPQASMVPPMHAGKGQRSSKGLLIALILVVVVALAAGGFGVWAYGGRQDYKNNTDKKVSAAVDTAVKQESDRKDAEFVNQEKQPYKTYTTPEVTGSIKITYPKTWSGYTEEDSNSTLLVNAYWHPGIVPGPKSNTAYALRLEISNKAYTDEVKSLDNLVKSGGVKVVPYAAKNVSGTTGVRVTGEVTKGMNTTMVILPIRDKTVKLYTQSPDFAKDFNDVVLANLTFIP